MNCHPAELAGEIRDAYKFKKIVIVHSRKGLASDAMGEKFQEKLKSTCEKLEIELKLGEKVTNLEDVVSNKCKRQTLKLRWVFQHIVAQMQFSQFCKTPICTSKIDRQWISQIKSKPSPEVSPIKNFVSFDPYFWSLEPKYIVLIVLTG